MIKEREEQLRQQFIENRSRKRKQKVKIQPPGKFSIFKNQPERIEARPTLKDQLSRLDHDQLQALVLRLTERDPGLTRIIEEFIGSLESKPSKGTGSLSTTAQIATKAVYSEVSAPLHHSERMYPYWRVEGVVDEAHQSLEQVWAYIQAGDGRNALSLLEDITNAFISEWEEMDDSDGEGSMLFDDLDPAWTEALLSTDLSVEEREEWAETLGEWQQEVVDYGIDNAFETARKAALHGWDDPALQNILSGESNPDKEWVKESSEIIVARLQILERRGFLEEYLRLARAQSQREAYVTMLVRLGRTQEAINYGREHLVTAPQFFTLATALYNYGEREQSLLIAEEGLQHEGSKTSLAKWLRDQADAAGKQAVALTAAEVAFREDISLANYQRVAEIAGEQWAERRESLLDYARHKKSYFPDGQVDVFLYEKLIDDAIAVVEHSMGSYTLIERVADNALLSRPEWVIKVSRQQAEPIMNEGKAKYYDAAARWIGKVRTAYLNMGRPKEWDTYLAELLDRHQRKYKLVPMLKALE
jgi:uncharacterized Zn finger protein